MLRDNLPTTPVVECRGVIQRTSMVSNNKSINAQIHNIRINVDTPLQWRHNGYNGISNHRPLQCLLKWWFRHRLKKKHQAPRHWPLWGEFTGDRWIPRTKGQWRGNVSVWWHHDGNNSEWLMWREENWYDVQHIKCPKLNVSANKGRPPLCSLEEQQVYAGLSYPCKRRNCPFTPCRFLKSRHYRSPNSTLPVAAKTCNKGPLGSMQTINKIYISDEILVQYLKIYKFFNLCVNYEEILITQCKIMPWQTWRCEQWKIVLKLCHFTIL